MRHLFSFTDRLTQAIKKFNRKQLCLLDLGSKTEEQLKRVEKKNVQLVEHQRRCSHELPFLQGLVFLENINLWPEVSEYTHILCWVATTLCNSLHSNTMLLCPAAEWQQSCRWPTSSTYIPNLFILRIMISWLQNYFSFNLLVHSFILLMNKALSLHVCFDEMMEWMILEVRV